MSDLHFIDADGHIIEPPHGLPEFAPKGYEDKVFHVETDLGTHTITLARRGDDWVPR